MPLLKMPPAAKGSFEKSPLDPTKLLIIFPQKRVIIKGSGSFTR